MLRRKPTRIELKLDDLEEFEAIKREKELEKKKQKAAAASPMSETISGVSVKLRDVNARNARIGYDPTPTPKPSTPIVHLYHL